MRCQWKVQKSLAGQGYLTDAWFKYIYAALWLGWNAHFWCWRVRCVERGNRARLERARVLSLGNGGWQEADAVPKPMGWWDDDEEADSSGEDDEERGV